MAANHDQVDPMRWLWRGLAAFVVVVGWLFILWTNNFHLSPPTVFLMIAYFALVGVIYNLFRTGASAVKAPEASEELDDSTWGKPIGLVGELEREKKTLLKAIKEAEFDREMGKLSAADATQMIQQYRARAIEVIKEIERLAGQSAGLSKREQIEREIRARLELEAKPKKKAAAAAAAAKRKGPRRAEAAAMDKAEAEPVAARNAEPETPSDGGDAAPSDVAPRDAEPGDAKADDAKAGDAKADAKPGTKTVAEPSGPVMAKPDDDVKAEVGT